VTPIILIEIGQISDQLPESAGAFLLWLKTPSSRWWLSRYALLLSVLLSKAHLLIAELDVR
jgi:hypothetical protein